MEFAAGTPGFVMPGADHPNSAAMRFNDAASNGEAQSRSAAFEAVLPRRMLVQVSHGIELVEDKHLVAMIDSDAGVGYNHLVISITEHTSLDGDLPPIWCIFDSIGHQVAECLRKTLMVSFDGRNFFYSCDLQSLMADLDRP